MKKGTCYLPPAYGQNRLFDVSDPILNMNRCNEVFVILKEMLARQGCEIATQDLHPPEESDFIIFFDLPRKNICRYKGKKYLLMLESPVVRPDNWRAHQDFDKVFTWDPALVDGKKYFKIHYSLGFDGLPQRVAYEQKKFCALVASNKYQARPAELYSERLNAIRWFEENHPDEFEFYGRGWDRRRFKGLFRPFNRVKMVGRRLAEPHPCYRGEVQARDVLPCYRFAICYENVDGIRGYISEKILTCLLSGCVAVYRGAPDITDYVPGDLFIDQREFSNYEQLYDFLKAMSRDRYETMLDRAAAFVGSEGFRIFTPRYFAGTLAREISRDLGQG